jgi:hypothetical protein
VKPIATVGELEQIRALPRAFVFIYVNWAVQARQSEAALIKFIDAWSVTVPQCAIPAYRVDLSDQEGDLWSAIRTWLQAEGQPVDSLTYGGGGALLWVRAGRVQASVPHVAIVERSKLMAHTNEIYACG